MPTCYPLQLHCPQNRSFSYNNSVLTTQRPHGCSGHVPYSGRCPGQTGALKPPKYRGQTLPSCREPCTVCTGTSKQAVYFGFGQAAAVTWAQANKPHHFILHQWSWQQPAWVTHCWKDQVTVEAQRTDSPLAANINHQLKWVIAAFIAL